MGEWGMAVGGGMGHGGGGRCDEDGFGRMLMVWD